MSDEAKLFTTHRKAKIGKDYSWPVGAEIISAALADVPQANMITLSFGPNDYLSPRSNLPPLVLEATYYFRGPSISSPSGSQSPSWQIEIRAVLRTQKNRVKSLLTESGFPERIKPWLVKYAGPSNREGSASVRLWYDATENRLICRHFGGFGPARADDRAE